MAFGIGTNTESLEHQALAGTYRDVAVKCWFTSTGRAIPLMLKVQIENEEIIEVKHMRVLTSDKQYFAGVINWKYKCLAEVNHNLQEFTLLFNPEECSWKLVE